MLQLSPFIAQVSSFSQAERHFSAFDLSSLITHHDI
jgi:hypothetical protein